MNLKNIFIALFLLLTTTYTNAGIFGDISKAIIKPIERTTKNTEKAIKSIKIQKDIRKIIKEGDSLPSIVLCPEGPPCSKHPIIK